MGEDEVEEEEDDDDDDDYNDGDDDEKKEEEVDGVWEVSLSMKWIYYNYFASTTWSYYHM